VRIEERTFGFFVVAEEADLCYLSGPREVGPMNRDTAAVVAEQAQTAVDAERTERLAPYV
jgi:hypothetical protein